jgi:hypothetical protein
MIRVKHYAIVMDVVENMDGGVIVNVVFFICLLLCYCRCCFLH